MILAYIPEEANNTPTCQTYARTHLAAAALDARDEDSGQVQAFGWLGRSVQRDALVAAAAGNTV